MFDLAGKVALVTGCRRGIGLAMAEALAQAGADVVGTSLNSRRETRRRARASRRPVARSSPTAPTSAIRTAPPISRVRSRATDTRSTYSSTTRGRSPAPRLSTTPTRCGRPSSRRISHPPSSSPEKSAGRWSSADAARSSSPHLSSASRAASTSRATPAAKSGLVGPRARALERVGAARRERQRDRARLHRHRQHAGPARRRRAVSGDPRPDPGRPLGRAGRPRRRDRLPRIARPRTTSTASCFRWTADGSGDDGRRPRCAGCGVPPAVDPGRDARRRCRCCTARARRSQPAAPSRSR